MPEGVKRKLAAIVSADVVGYSRLIGADEAGTLAAMRAHRAELWNPTIDCFGGRVVGTAGDSLLVEFASAVAAVESAIALQQGMVERNTDRPEDAQIWLRIGVNIGEVVVDGEDIHGDGVNVATRLQEIAEPGGLAVSANVHEQVAGKLAVTFADLGALRLKNIERPIRAYALRNVGGGAPAGQARAGHAGGSLDLSRFERPSIVVMPYKDLGGGDRDSLAEGLRLSLHSVLIKLSGLFLLHTGTVERYRGQNYSIIDVGREIDVRYVVEGAVQRAGDRVRVTMEMTDVLTGRLVWGERYDRVVADTFDLQDEIALEIVKALDIELRTGEAGRVRVERISKVSALEYLHRGVSHLYKGTKDDTAAARRMLEKLDEVEPDLPLCLGMIALTHWRDAKFGWSEDAAESLRKASQYAQRTIDLGDPEGFGHAIIGHALVHQRRHDAALESSLEALSRRPSCPLANGLLAEVMQYCGEPHRAVMQIREAMRLVRVFPPWMINTLAASLRDNDELADSISAANQAVRLFPDEPDGLAILCCDYGLSASLDEAQKVGRHLRRVDPSFSISRYAESQPYKDKAVVDRIVEGLSRAGLPG